MLWVQLNQCRVGDKKLRKLSDALRTNTAVTSVDLSHNQITDSGVEVSFFLGSVGLFLRDTFVCQDFL